MYLGWYDPDKKRTDDQKLQDACERYRRKWGREPRTALVNVASTVTPNLFVEIHRVGHVAPNVFFVGDETEEGITSGA